MIGGAGMVIGSPIQDLGKDQRCHDRGIGLNHESWRVLPELAPADLAEVGP
jgi:hypothetical protein